MNYIYCEWLHYIAFGTGYKTCAHAQDLLCKPSWRLETNTCGGEVCRESIFALKLAMEKLMAVITVTSGFTVKGKDFNCIDLIASLT